MDSTETRFGVELRSEVKGNKLIGHAGRVRSCAEVPGHLEALHRSAFDAVRKDAGTDVRALFNHDPSKLLGRQSSGTLRWSVDSTGLPFECDLPDTSVGRDVRELAQRGDLNGASFGFLPGADAWSRTQDGRQLRTHTSVSRLVDVSIVTFPAYTGTSVMLRSLDRIPLNRPAMTESRASQLIRARHRILFS
ncbi:HK97 family phage prohead protease [Mycolicibacterium farcinogenes]|nr:HK97 family phage prohead protease [Mycolicibacterium farcinogenes]